MGSSPEMPPPPPAPKVLRSPVAEDPNKVNLKDRVRLAENQRRGRRATILTSNLSDRSKSTKLGGGGTA